MLALPIQPSKPAGRDADEVAELPGAVTLVAESGGDRDVREWQLGFDEQLLDALDPALEHEPVRRHARRLLECAREIVDRQAGELRQHGVADVFRQMSEDIFTYSPECARRQAPARRHVDGSGFGNIAEPRDDHAGRRLHSVRRIVHARHHRDFPQRCMRRSISSRPGISMLLRSVMIHSEPATTRNTMSTPNASASTLLVLSGPVVMWRKKTRCTPIWAMASTARPSGMPGGQINEVFATQKDVPVRITATASPTV